ncbi:MAG TPA: hypothetical protein VN719_13060 [Gemmatimonadales bacterium]|jgi:hypothetical protein|nr:hypothetical protein [Gemmatimonadales bacterium]
MRFRGWFALAAAASVTFGTLGCSDSSTGPSVNLSGTYSLVSIQFPPQPALTPPAATGTFTLTTTTYTLHLVIQGQGTVDDNGTYALNGSNWSQSSTTTGQATGTYSMNGNMLTVNATAQGVTSISVWQKQ